MDASEDCPAGDEGVTSTIQKRNDIAAACIGLLRQQHAEVHSMLSRHYKDLSSSLASPASEFIAAGPRGPMSITRNPGKVTSIASPPPELVTWTSPSARRELELQEDFYEQVNASLAQRANGYPDEEDLRPAGYAVGEVGMSAPVDSTSDTTFEISLNGGHDSKSAATATWHPNGSDERMTSKTSSAGSNVGSNGGSSNVSSNEERMASKSSLKSRKSSRMSQIFDTNDGVLARMSSQIITETSMSNRANLESILAKKRGATWQSRFDAFIGVIVLLNAIVMVLDLEWQGTAKAVLLGRQEQHGWEYAKDVIYVLEIVFTCIFVFEMLFRIYQHGRKCCLSLWNIFDSTIVVISCIDVFILTPLTSTSVSNVALLRLMRMTRLVRAFRIVRTLRLFKGLRVLLSACTSFLPSLFWSMILLTLLMTMCGLMIGNLLQEFIADPSKDIEDRLWVWLHYGTAYRAVYTMYEVTFAGNWPIYARPVLENVDQSFCLFFFLYVTLVVFAVTRVIAAIILRDTMEAAGSDAEVVIQEREAKKASYVKKLESVFRAADTSGDNLICLEEMEELMKDNSVRTYLQALELEVHETTALFKLLDDGDGFVTYDEFINGILRFKGGARAIDLMAMNVELKQLMSQVDSLAEKVSEVLPGPGGDTRPRRHSFKTVQQRNNFKDVEKDMSAFRTLMVRHASPTSSATLGADHR
eukprot:TRINITY_DN32621_c0_g1_i1.p1 TRINITY_DN32621_c0_g1~~TRINITY_DN32621_c0_g1_i1.p1  ORF type:complete len:700 (-),score=106.70 TRINITY_DN32621_c0_g1_i1:133-2232(-)